MVESSEKLGFFSRIGYGLSAGLLGGSFVGISEGAWILTSTTPSEYQAIRYGAVLYGLIGGGMGLGIGTALAILSGLVRLSRARSWCLSFFGVVAPLGLLILRYILNKQWYLEKGVPMSTTLGILAMLGVVSLVGVWIGGNLLTKSPLRVLPGLKGTVTAWGAVLGIAWIFSLSPAPGASGDMSNSPKQGPEFAKKPDVILIMVDTLRADALGAYGAGAAASPAIDAFARDSVVFDQMITSASWTRASTASLMTSRYPSSHTCETKDAALPDAVTTLAEQLSGSGYATGGLPNNANVTAAVGFGQGFSWYPYDPEYPLWAAESSYSLSFYSVVRKLYTKVNKRKRVEDYYMPAPTQFRRASEFLTANKDVRSFLFLHIMDAHDPYFRHPYDGYAYGRAEFPNPPPEMKNDLRQLYAGEVAFLDQAFADFVGKLKAEGRYDQSLIIVTADHGEEFMEHGGWWHGTTLYDEQIRVPLIVKLPNNERAGVRVPWQVRQVDIAPTITQLADLAPGDGWQGVPLFDDQFDQHLAFGNPLADQDPTGEPALPAPDATLPPTQPPLPQERPSGPVVVDWSEHPASRSALSEQNFEGYDLQSLRRKGVKLIQALTVPVGNARNQPPEQLFDMKKDPAEQMNLAGQGDARQAEAASELAQILKLVQGGAVEAVVVEQSCEEIQQLVQLGYMTEDGIPERCKGK